VRRDALRTVAVGLAAAIGTALIIGIPSDVIPNPWFTRQIGVDGFDVFVLLALSLLTGALAATYVRQGAASAAAERAGIGSGIVGFLAISCPVCNKIVIGLIGASGATGWFASLQPLLGLMAIGLGSAALVVRLRAIRRATCELPTRASGAPADVP
jgi:hypothetical protein